MGVDCCGWGTRRFLRKGREREESRCFCEGDGGQSSVSEVVEEDMAAGCLLDHGRCPSTISFSQREVLWGKSVPLFLQKRQKIVVGCRYRVLYPTPEGVVR